MGRGAGPQCGELEGTLLWGDSSWGARSLARGWLPLRGAEFRDGGSSRTVREAREPHHSVGKGKRGVWEGPICREKGGLVELG